jgi:multiple sugar transport system permease protein|tara:strand:+ start:2464 stop:3222 length:759 start_codon:yes stop_codon:yes gene_type:complete
MELYATPIKSWFPSEPTWEAYIRLFQGGGQYRGGNVSPTEGLMWSGLYNTLFVSIVSALFVTFLSTNAGYVFARMKFRGRGFIFFFLMLMMPLPLWVSIIALFFMISNAGLIDTLSGMILLFIVFLLPLGIWLMSTFIREINPEIEEAAIVDGCSRWQLLRWIIYPLSKSGMAAVFLVSLLTVWNNFLLPLIFTRSPDSQMLTVVLSLFVGQYEVAWEDMAAAAVVTMLPPFLIALFFQRFLIRGMTLGAVK